MMSEYSDFILVNRNTLGQYIFVGSHRMSENSGVGLQKFPQYNESNSCNPYTFSNYKLKGVNKCQSDKQKP